MQVSLTKYYSSNTASSSTGTDCDEETNAALTSSDDERQNSDEDDWVPPPAKRAATVMQGEPPRRDRHRKSGFNYAWLEEFTWLERVCDGAKTGLKCKLCTQYGKSPRNRKGTWTTTACFALRRDKIVKHEKSSMHKAAITTRADAAGGGIEKSFSDKISLEMKAVIGCLKCIYWLCKNEIAHTTTYPNLLQLAEELGCEYFKSLRVGHNATYTSRQVIHEFLGIMNDMIQESVLQSFRDSTYFSLMVDESTDISVLKQLVLYGRTVVKGKLKSCFLKIVDLEDGKALTITNAITSYLETAGLSTDRMSSFGSDGATVMVGGRSGVATQLRACNEQMISVHCVCHRLALASSQASSDVDYFKKFKNYLLSLYNFFHNSPVRSARLKQVQEVLSIPQLKIARAVDTRWLSHKSVISTLLKTLPAVLVYLYQQEDPTAIGLYKVMATYSFFASLLLLDEVLSAVNRLSLAFQRSVIDLTTISPLLHSTVHALENIKCEPADAFKAKVVQLISKTTEEGAGLHLSELETASNTEITMVIKTGVGEAERYENQIRQKFLDKVITNVNERFPQVGILEAFSALDPALGMLGEPETSTEYLSQLMDHYNMDGTMGIDWSACEREYSEITSFVKQHTLLKKCATLQELSESVLSRESIVELFPNMNKLFVHALVLPVSTVDCERCFSLMKRVKTTLRNRMSTTTLDALL